jgi:hypothetical protein
MPMPPTRQITPRARVGAPWLAALSVAAALVASSCGGADPKDLRSAAESLVPRESRVVEHHEGACMQLSTPPSCVKLSFLTDTLPRERRVELVRSAARAHDWDSRGQTAFPRETWLYFGRGNYEATAVILNDKWRALCRTESKCGDSITVIRR